MSGKAFVGAKNEKSLDAVWLVVLGTVINTIINSLFSGIIAFIILMVVFLALVKHFFDLGWLKAFIISLLVVIIFAVIIAILAIVRIGLELF